LYLAIQFLIILLFNQKQNFPMKKLLNLLMVFFFVAALAACGGAETGDDSGDGDSTNTEVPADTAQDVAPTEPDSVADDSGNTDGE
jgi:hypothetical protein